MKHKRQKYTENEEYPDLEMQSPSQPVKSPSPDKNRSKMITPTKSPELIDIKRNLVQSRLEERRFEKTPLGSKPHEQSTRYYTNQDFQEYRSSHKKNQIFEELENMLPQEFTVDNTQMYRSATHQNSKQLDYLKLLQEKQKTIKQLHEIIEMINRNNSLQLSSSSVSNNNKSRKIFDSTNKSTNKSMYSGTKYPEISQDKELKNQVRILTIQNQQLIHMIEKLNQEKKTIEQIDKNIAKERIDYSSHRMKQEILSREIHQMKESLLQKDEDYAALVRENKELYVKYIQLDQENQKLIKMMKEKELSDRKYHSSLIESNISQKSSISESQVKEKLSIQKIKEQYNQSLRVFKDTVYSDVEQFMREKESNVKFLQNRLNEMQVQLSTLQKFKLAYENLKRSKIIQSSVPSRRQQQLSLQKYELHEISQIHVVSPQKQHYREIESLLMQKNQLYEKELETERKTSRQLSEEVEKLREKYELLEIRYNELKEFNQQMMQKAKQQQQQQQQQQQSPQRNVQIEDINEAKARQAEIQKLCQLIQKCQEQFTQQKQSLLREITLLNKKNQTYQQIIESQRLEFQEKQNDVKTRISEKENELKRNQSHYKSQIDYLKELLSEKELHPQQSPQETEIEDLKQSLQLKEVEVQQKTKEVVELREKLEHMEETQDFAKEEIKKLVDNYETEIGILKADKQKQRQNYERQEQKYQQKVKELKQQISNLNSQLNRLSISSNQLPSLKARIQQLQGQLNTKHRQSRQLLHSKQALQLQHSELKEHIEQLLVISKHVEELQEENRQMKDKIQEDTMRVKELQMKLEKQADNLREVEKERDDMGGKLKDITIEKGQLQNQVKRLEQQLSSAQSQLSQLQSQLSQLQSQLSLNRKQSQSELAQKDIHLAQQIEKYQQQKLQYQQIITQLKQQVSTLNTDLHLLRQENLSHRQIYNQLLLTKQPNQLNQLYQLRSLVAKSLQTGEAGIQEGSKEWHYDLGKLYIDYQAALDHSRLLNVKLDQLNQQVNKSHQEKILLQEKIAFLQKNISIYQNQLKERKTFCQQLLNDNTKLQKELLLIKKLKLQSRLSESESIKSSLLERVNKLVRFEQNRENELKRFAEKRSESPIKQINYLISKVEEKF